MSEVRILSPRPGSFCVCIIMDKMVAYCGLDCRKCDAYVATINDDWKLRKKTAEKWSKLNNAQILPEHINCHGCRADGIKTVFCQDICAIRKCALKKKVEACKKCPDMKECETIQTFLFDNPNAYFTPM